MSEKVVEEIKFEVQTNLLSLNRIYRVNRVGKIYKTTEAKEWEKDFFFLLPSPSGWWAKKKKRKCALGLKLLFYATNPYEFDLDNQLKLLIDVLEQKYNFNDSWIHFIEVAKVKAKETKIIGRLYKL